MANAIIIAILVCLVFLVVRFLIKKLAKESLGCNGNCTSCQDSTTCHSDTSKKI